MFYVAPCILSHGVQFDCVRKLRKMAVGVANDGLVAVLLSTTLLLLSLPHATNASPSGPPVNMAGLCSDMTPQHPGSTPQTSAPPYTITTSATCYTPGQAVTGKHLTRLYNSLGPKQHCSNCSLAVVASPRRMN